MGCSFLAERMPKVKVRIPEGTYVMWMDFSGYGISPKEVHDRIYNKANVLLEDGHYVWRRRMRISTDLYSFTKTDY